MRELSSYTFPILVFYIVHAVLVILVLRFRRNKRKYNEGVFEWIGLVSIFIPIIGTAFGYLAFLASKLFPRDTVHDYEKYIDFKFSNYDEVLMQAKKDMQLVPFSAGLETGNAAVRKDLIVRLMESQISKRGKYLERALGSSDTETVHYAATTMNHLKENYDKVIEQQTEELSSLDPNSYLVLCNTYRQSLESKLINSFMEKKVYEQFKKVVEQAILYFPRYLEFWDYLVEINEKLGQAKEALTMAENMVQHFPNRYEGYVRLLQLYIAEGEFSRIPEVYKALEKHVDAASIPSTLEPVLAQIRGI